MTQQSLYAAKALLPQGWTEQVLISWDATGVIREVSSGVARPADVAVADGLLVPGVPNLHSHAFQRAMAGATEIMSSPSDSFWSWRTLMYHFAARISPAQLQAVARHLYIEMLQAGYSHVCEFHYLHHDRDGQAFADPAEMSAAIVRAAQEVGIGLTLLPVLYQYAGFGEQPANSGQRRFVSSPDWMLRTLDSLRRQFPETPLRRYGVAPHSLRAVSRDGLSALVTALAADTPIHIHIAEQTREVEECLAAYGQTPVAWLLDQHALADNWCLVHATHMTPDEYQRVARSGAVVGLCPTTEANLGDGLFDAETYLALGGAWGIGSDSNIAVSPWAEWRLLEYGQRLQHRRRNVLASNSTPAVADRLFTESTQRAASATGLALGALAPGLRADFLVLGTNSLGEAVFCEHGTAPVKDSYVAGLRVMQAGCHLLAESARAEFNRVLRELHA